METTVRRPNWGIVLLAILCGVITPWFSLALCVAPGLLAYLALAGKPGRFLPAVVVTVVGLGLLYDWTTAAYYTGLLLPTALVLWGMLKRQKAYSNALIFCCALITLGLYALLCLPSLLSGNSAFFGIQSYVAELKELLLSDPMLPQEEVKLLTPYLDTLYQGIPQYVTGLLCIPGMLFGLTNLCLARTLAKKAGVPCKQSAPFSEWRLHKGFLFGAIILLLGVIVVHLLDLNGAEAVWTTVQIVLCVPLAAQGFCTLVFLFRRGQMRGTVVILIVVIIAVLFTVLFPVLSLFGLIEQLFSIREKSKAH